MLYIGTGRNGLLTGEMSFRNYTAKYRNKRFKFKVIHLSDYTARYYYYVRYYEHFCKPFVYLSLNANPIRFVRTWRVAWLRPVCDLRGPQNSCVLFGVHIHWG
jgi:hypothetical protein